jgi:hypothetical protein
MHHWKIFDIVDSLDKCMSMGVDYVHVVVDSLNDLFVFNASNFLSPNYYPIE